MSRPHHLKARFFITALATLVGLTFSACASAPRPEAVIHQDAGLAVLLEPLPDSEIQATHPLVLPASTVARLLRGVQVVGDKSAVESLFDSKLKPTPVFSEPEIAAMTPHLVAALAKAAPTQQVRFRLSHLVSPVAYQDREGAAVGSSQPPPYGLEPETTTGRLYAYGRSIYLTLDDYRQRPARPDAVNMPNRRLPDRTGLDRLRVGFAPEAARRPEIYQQSGVMSESNRTTLVIDYQLLATLPAAAGQAAAPAAKPAEAQAPAPSGPARGEVRPAPAPATEQELQSVKDLLIKKELEMQEMKEELRAIKKQLSDQEEARQPAKPRKKSPASKDPLP